MKKLLFFFSLIVLLGACGSAAPPAGGISDPYILVLGVAQDGGYPQAGCNRPHCERGWQGGRIHVASLAIIDPMTRQRWLIDATPDFPWQLRALDQVMPVDRSPGLDGIFLTHAHIGHYTGLMHLGREVIGASEVPVHAMPRMKQFLEENGPWSLLVKLRNIVIRPLADGEKVRLNDRISVTPFLVPHRDEFSETAGFRVDGPNRSLIYIPDIDKWETWLTPIESVIRSVDLAFVDATFFGEDEIPGRIMADIPHPFIVESMQRFSTLSSSDRKKVHFIHLNHTNPALDPKSPQRRAVGSAGFAIAQEGSRFGI